MIILGSSRSAGNTGKAANYVSKLLDLEMIDLNKRKIGHFDYEFRNRDDDFLPVIKEALNYPTIIFATPVYWYSMSGKMKAFFDRFTDLLRVEKEMGRALRGKNMAMISCGSDPNLPEGFTMPFSETAGYLGMNYVGDVHVWAEGEEIPKAAIDNLEAFVKKLISMKTLPDQEAT